MKSNQQRAGYRSAKNGHLGVYTLCSGPDPNGPVPGERLIIVIYNQDDQIVRRLEEVRGRCLDEGYVDYFESSRCRPAVYEYHFVDIDQDGHKKILATHTGGPDARAWLVHNVPIWVKTHGIPQ